MGRSSDRWFVARQITIVAVAVVAYFGVRGLTEGEVATADRNGRSVLEFERHLSLDHELGLQAIIASSQVTITLANWAYIWLHWPVLIATLVWLLVHDRSDFVWLRNAMIVSGGIGLVVFATMPVTPPRFFGAYTDTVTQHSYSYRVLQPPVFVNAYAAMPSLHFGWNLLAGIVWFRRSRTGFGKFAAIVMPTLMGFAVVATGNHWVLDVVAGGAIAGVGAVVSTEWRFRQAEAAVDSARTCPSSNCQRVPQLEQRKSTTAYDDTSGASPSPEHRGQASNGGSTRSAGCGATRSDRDRAETDGREDRAASDMDPSWNRSSDRSSAERQVDHSAADRERA